MKKFKHIKQLILRLDKLISLNLITQKDNTLTSFLKVTWRIKSL